MADQYGTGAGTGVYDDLDKGSKFEKDHKDKGDKAYKNKGEKEKEKEKEKQYKDKAPKDTKEKEKEKEKAPKETKGDKNFTGEEMRYQDNKNKVSLSVSVRR